MTVTCQKPVTVPPESTVAHAAVLMDEPVPTRPPTRPVTRAGAEPRRGQANVGDQIVVHRHAHGEPDRDGEVLETSPAGNPPFRVRWADTGKVTFFYPGPDAEIRHLAHRH
jgi:hypothetical protein